MGIPDDIKHRFFEVLNENGKLLQFEAWLYTNPKLENILPDSFYFELIEFNYKQHDAEYLFQNLLEKYINKGEFEEWRIRKLLTKALKNDHDLPKILECFYDLYCNGYSFFDNLGLGYGLNIATGYDERKRLIKAYPSIRAEVEKVLYWLDNQKIVLTGLKDEFTYQYFDYRNPEEKKPTAYSIVDIPPKKTKAWWKFW